MNPLNYLYDRKPPAGLIDVRELMHGLSQAQLLESADAYFASMSVQSEQCRKPFSNPADAVRVVLASQSPRRRELLTLIGIPHEVRLLPGHHTAEYWTDHAGDYIRFYSRSLVGGPLGAVNTP